MIGNLYFKQKFPRISTIEKLVIDIMVNILRLCLVYKFFLYTVIGVFP